MTWRCGADGVDVVATMAQFCELRHNQPQNLAQFDETAPQHSQSTGLFSGNSYPADAVGTFLHLLQLPRKLFSHRQHTPFWRFCRGIHWEVHSKLKASHSVYTLRAANDCVYWHPVCAQPSSAMDPYQSMWVAWAVR